MVFGIKPHGNKKRETTEKITDERVRDAFKHDNRIGTACGKPAHLIVANGHSEHSLWSHLLLGKFGLVTRNHKVC
jgi:hypothetical protein